MADLRTLSKTERRILNTLEGLENFIAKYDPAKDEAQVSVRLETLETVCKEFYGTRTEIELLMDEAAGDEPDQRAELAREQANLLALTKFEERYFAVKASLVSKQTPPPASTTAAGNGQPGDQSSFSKVKLPEISLPSFSGKIKEWMTFRDSFRSLIHGNKQLNNMDRFSYLKSALSGEALQEIESVELTAANYSVAWKALVSRYENKKLIVKTHLDSLFAAEGLKRESYDSLSNLIGVFEKNLQMLQKIGEDTTAWSTILAYMVYSRLDPATLRQWETHHNSKEVPTYENLITFLRSHCSVLQSVASTSSRSSPDRRSPKSSVCHAIVKSWSNCPFCGELWHSAFVCGKFQGMQVPERSEAVIKAKLCRNCLRPGHWARDCERGGCHHCQQNHHSLLHGASVRSSVPQSQSNPPAPSTQTRRQPQSRPQNPNQQTQTTSTATDTNSHRESTQSSPTTTATHTTQTHVALPITPTQNILLSTALVKIRDRHGKAMLARALLDSCSQHCLMTKEFSDSMNFHTSPSSLSVQGIGSSTSTSTELVTAVVGSRLNHISSFSTEMQFHVLPQLTVSLPTAICDPSGWDLPDSAFLADPRFFEPAPIDVIIGAEYYMDLLRNERRKATKSGPTLQNTEFGWIVSGKVPDRLPIVPQSFSLFCSTAKPVAVVKRSAAPLNNDVPCNRRHRTSTEVKFTWLRENRLPAYQQTQRNKQRSRKQRSGLHQEQCCYRTREPELTANFSRHENENVPIVTVGNDGGNLRRQF